MFVYGFAGVTGAFTQMGVPFPGVMGPLIGVLEFFGGVALAIGLLTRLIAIGLVFDMLGAILLVQMKRGFSSLSSNSFYSDRASLFFSWEPAGSPSTRCLLVATRVE